MGFLKGTVVGCLADSGGRACNSWSQRGDFEQHDGRRVYLIKKRRRRRVATGPRAVLSSEWYFLSHLLAPVGWWRGEPGRASASIILVARGSFYFRLQGGGLSQEGRLEEEVATRILASIWYSSEIHVFLCLWKQENIIFFCFFVWKAFLQELVDRDNSKFEEWCIEMAEMRKQSVDKGKAKHEEVKELYQRLPAGAGL